MFNIHIKYKVIMAKSTSNHLYIPDYNSFQTVNLLFNQSPLPRLMVNSLNFKPLISFSFLNLQSDICDWGLPVVLSHSFLWEK